MANGKFTPSNPLFHRADFWEQVWSGKINGFSLTHKFGRNPSVGTNLVPITISGNYKTPIAAVNLEVISDDTNDTSNGSGARSIKIIGLDANWNQLEEIVLTNGTSASSPTTNKFIRVFRAYVNTSGSYATQNVSSQKGTITIRESGGGDTWAEIDEAVAGFGVGQSQIACYTIPKGYTGFVKSKFVSVDVNQETNVYFFHRPNANKISAPYSAMRLLDQEDGIKQPYYQTQISPLYYFEQMTDIGFMGKTTTGTASISASFELLLIQNGLI